MSIVAKFLMTEFGRDDYLLTPIWLMDFVALLKKGVESWNQWRSHYPNFPCTLEGADLSGQYLFECDLSGVNLKNVNLQRACLIGADFRWADLTDANLIGAYLSEANFYGANLNGTDFTDASLERADLRRVHRLGKQMDAGITLAQMSKAVKEAAALSSVAQEAGSVQVIERPINVASAQQQPRFAKLGLSNFLLRFAR